MKSLLEQLRTSQAWQETVQQTPASDQAKTAESTSTPASSESGQSNTSTEAAATTTSVASLLSQLESSLTWAAAIPSPPVLSPPIYASTTPTHAPRTNASYSSTQPVVHTLCLSPTPRQDTRSYTFQQALPHLVQLSDDPNFVATLSQVRGFHFHQTAPHIVWCRAHI